MSARWPVAVALLAVTSASTGCSSFSSELGRGISDVIFGLGCLLLGMFGLAGVVMIAETARGRVGPATLAVQGVLGVTALVLTGLATSGFSPWPGDFAPRTIAWLWLPSPLGAAALVSLGRWLVDRGRPARAVWTVTLAAAGAQAALLAHASLAVLPKPFPHAFRELAVADSTSYARADNGAVLLVHSKRELPGRFRLLRGNTRGAVAIDEAGSVVAFPGLRPPVRVPLSEAARSIAAGPRFDVAVDARGRVYGFDVSADPKSVEAHGWFGPAPRAVPELGEVDEVVVSAGLICGHRKEGSATCVSAPTGGRGSELFSTRPFGGSGSGQPRFTGPSAERPAAVRVLVDRGARGVAATTGSACVLDADGTVRCAGDDEDGEVTLGEEPAPQAELTLIAGIEAVEQIVAGARHLCARTDRGAVACWGGNLWGQLGGGPRGPRPTPVPLPVPAAELFGFSGSTCARLEDGRFFCWGGQREPGATITRRRCVDPLFSNPVTCSDGTEPIALPTTFLPARPG